MQLLFLVDNAIFFIHTPGCESFVHCLSQFCDYIVSVSVIVTVMSLSKLTYCIMLLYVIALSKLTGHR